jgi:hypothetical protein
VGQDVVGVNTLLFLRIGVFSETLIKDRGHHLLGILMQTDNVIINLASCTLRYLAGQLCKAQREMMPRVSRIANALFLTPWNIR